MSQTSRRGQWTDANVRALGVRAVLGRERRHQPDGESGDDLSHEPEGEPGAAREPGSRTRHEPEDSLPLAVRVQFVVMEGSASRALGQRQADVMRKVLEWIVNHHDKHSR